VGQQDEGGRDVLQLLAAPEETLYPTHLHGHRKPRYGTVLAGVTCCFYGPTTVGRGIPLSGCPESNVCYMPESKSKNNGAIYSQTCLKQPHKGSTKSGCIRQVGA